jgi:hypothetical protein
MSLLIAKYAVTAFIIVLVSEVAKRSGQTGALIASLPLVTVMVMTWLHLEGAGSDTIAAHAWYTFWYVLPTLPMFVLMPWLMHRGMGYWAALAIGVLVTMGAFLVAAAVGRRLGVELMPW